MGLRYKNGSHLYRLANPVLFSEFVANLRPQP